MFIILSYYYSSWRVIKSLITSGIHSPSSFMARRLIKLLLLVTSIWYRGLLKLLWLLHIIILLRRHIIIGLSSRWHIIIRLSSRGHIIIRLASTRHIIIRLLARRHIIIRLLTRWSIKSSLSRRNCITSSYRSIISSLYRRSIKLLLPWLRIHSLRSSS